MGSKRTDPSRALELGLQFHQRGRLDKAEAHYRAVLSAQPRQFDAMHLLGLLRFQQGRYGEALDHISAALRLDPDAAGALSNLGLVLGALGRLDEALASFDKALAVEPYFAEALNNRGNVLLHLARLEEALASFEKAIKIMPGNVEALNGRGKTLLSLRRPAEALVSFDKALTLKRDHAEALRNRGATLLSLKRPKEALTSFDKALALQPDSVEALIGRGNALQGLERFVEALASFDKALSLRPDHVEALSGRGNALRGLKRGEEALASFDNALALQPDFVAALNGRGTTLLSLRQPAEALASFEAALAAKPDYAEALANRGVALADLKRPEEALASLDRALEIEPDRAEVLNNRGNRLLELRRPKEALASFDKALALKPDFAVAHNGRGSALLGLLRPDEALASFDMALALKPDFAEALALRGAALNDLKRPMEALASFDKALAIDPDDPGAGGQLNAALGACCWARAKEIADRQISLTRWRQLPITPFNLLACVDDPSIHLDCARHFIRKTLPEIGASPAPRRNGPVLPGDKLRIVYISADFRSHPVAALISELIELHDRARFEVLGISIGFDDLSDERSRLAKAFDRLLDVRRRGDQDVAQLLRHLQIDIAVDLTGHTFDSRLEILASRPAPIQVSYLGYPGTTGADFFDYAIADPVVLPFDQQPYYTERIVHLPDSYQANDSRRPIPSSIPTRQACGLPEDAFVFCSFNNTFKITEEIFDVWMRLLTANPRSVLWLQRANADAERNLRRSAEERKVDGGRLVFAGRVPSFQEHLARYRQADLFLDTLPYNAHTTASDALWAGLPVLTCMGRSFASRVAASLLYAAGLPELVTSSLADYEALAMSLAADPALLRRYRRRLEENRRTCALFDSVRFARNMERAYMKMWEIYRRGDPPQSFSVSA